MKEAKTIDEQIELMRSRNIEIPDEAKARESLLDIGYYRLGFFFLHLKWLSIFYIFDENDKNVK